MGAWALDFLQKFLNGIDEKYPFVDNVKPFSKFVKMFLVSEAKRDFGPMKALTVYWALVSFIGNRLAKAPKDLLGVEEFPRKVGRGNEAFDQRADQLASRKAQGPTG